MDMLVQNMYYRYVPISAVEKTKDSIYNKNNFLYHS